MTAVTTFPGRSRMAPPAMRHPRQRGTHPRACRRATTTFLRRRLALAGLVLGLVVVAGQVGAALGGSPLAVPERSAPLVRSVDVVVRPGDTLWSVAQRFVPGGDPRPVVDELAADRHGAPLLPGEIITWRP